jgi:hypothetical protein
MVVLFERGYVQIENRGLGNLSTFLSLVAIDEVPSL